MNLNLDLLWLHLRSTHKYTELYVNKPPLALLTPNTDATALESQSTRSRAFASHLFFRYETLVPAHELVRLGADEARGWFVQVGA